ncbi:MAG: epoxyqueuosine reductase [Deltaproteobacteria bacterium]|nr:MAG: epoxyqueuosine reductase [Deltaproteobacteria bacterium]
MGLREEVIEIAKSREIDLVGLARVEDIELTHPPRPAEDLLVGAKTTIVFAASLLWGALNCPRGTKGAVKDSQVAYDRLEHAGAAVGRYLESKGFACYLVPASMPVDVIKQDGINYYAAEWSHRQAAIAACLGVKGINNLLITPEYGPYVRISSMLTTAEIESTKRELLDDLCTECMECVNACPVSALNPDPNAQPRLNQPLCRATYIRPFLYPTVWQTLKSVFTTKGLGAMGVQFLLEGYYFSCAECQRVCPRGSLKARKEG